MQDVQDVRDGDEAMGVSVRVAEGLLDDPVDVEGEAVVDVCASGLDCGACGAGTEALHASFVVRREAARPAVQRMIRKGYMDDAEDAEAEVFARAWRAYPRMVAEEERELAAGRPSPHRWNAWFARIALNLVRDDLERRKVLRRLVAALPGEERVVVEALLSGQGDQELMARWGTSAAGVTRRRRKGRERRRRGMATAGYERRVSAAGEEAR